VRHRGEGLVAREVSPARQWRHPVRRRRRLLHDTKEQPRYQAYRYRSTIFDQFFALPEDTSKISQAVRAAVVFPNFSNTDARKLFDIRQVADEEQSVQVWGGDGLQQSLLEIVRGAGCPPPKPAPILRLKRQLVVPEPASNLAAVRLSEDAKNIASNPNNVRRRRVRSPAGCGRSSKGSSAAMAAATSSVSDLVGSGSAGNAPLHHYHRFDLHREHSDMELLQSGASVGSLFMPSVRCSVPSESSLRPSGPPPT
jgi:hypothetical protein